MPFKISYTGDMTSYMVDSSTPENKKEDFYKRMDTLASHPEFDEGIFDLMIQECEEYYDFEARCEGFGVVDYEEFNGYGKIEIERFAGKFGGKAWREEEAEHKSEFRDAHNKLREKVWFVEYYVQWKSVWEVEIDEIRFDVKKMNWKNSKVHYGDIPIDEDVAGQRPIAEEIILYWRGEERSF